MSDLKKKYPLEYNSWRAMMSRARRGICTVSPKFQDFDQFLEIMGPKPSPDATLDRRDPHDNEYAPKKVRWATKSLQARNRRNTVFLTYSGDQYPEFRDRKLSLSEWADVTGQNQSTMRRRRSEGWSDDDNIQGKRSAARKAFDQMSLRELLNFEPWDPGKEVKQRALFREHRDPDEDRFEFMLRVNMRRQRKLTTKYGDVVEDMGAMTDDERYDLADRDDEVFRDWIRRPHSSERRWLDFLDDAEHLVREERRLRKKRKRWLEAIEAYHDRKHDDVIQRELNRKLAPRKDREPEDD